MEKYEFNFWMAGGVNINDDLDDPVQTNSTISISASRRINYKRNVGIGFDIFYNEYLSRWEIHSVFIEWKKIL